MKTVEAIECSVCKKLHRITDETYIQIIGNIYFGNKKCLIGDGEPDAITILCKQCFLLWVQKSIPEEIIYRECYES